MNRKDKLRYWAKVLQRVKRQPTKFNMNYWKPDRPENKQYRQEGVCHTACCAAGHAALDPVFRAMGFKLPEVANVLSAASVMTFFELSVADTDWLTAPIAYTSSSSKFKRPDFEQKRVRDSNNITPEMVIERINYLIETLP